MNFKFSGAYKAAEKAANSVETEYNYPFMLGACIFKGHKIISIGKSAKRSCSKIKNKYLKYSYTLHAEQNAVVNAPQGKSLKGYSILIIRFTPGGRLSMALPCEYCMKTLKSRGIRKVYYSDFDGNIEFMKI